jgi:hypothetical protein
MELFIQNRGINETMRTVAVDESKNRYSANQPLETHGIDTITSSEISVDSSS